jgi:uncharacterized membrane protein YccC
MSKTPRTDALRASLKGFEAAMELCAEIEKQLAEAQDDAARLQWIFDNVMYLPMDNGINLPMSRIAIDIARRDD